MGFQKERLALIQARKVRIEKETRLRVEQDAQREARRKAILAESRAVSRRGDVLCRRAPGRDQLPARRDRHRLDPDQWPGRAAHLADIQQLQAGRGAPQLLCGLREAGQGQADPPRPATDGGGPVSGHEAAKCSTPPSVSARLRSRFCSRDVSEGDLHLSRRQCRCKHRAWRRSIPLIPLDAKNSGIPCAIFNAQGGEPDRAAGRSRVSGDPAERGGLPGRRADPGPLLSRLRRQPQRIVREPKATCAP